VVVALLVAAHMIRLAVAVTAKYAVTTTFA